MHRLWLLVLLAGSPLALGGNAKMAPPVHWTLPQPDRRKPADGYTALEGVEHVELFHATPTRGHYCHHPHIAHHGGVFYATWSNHPTGEDGPGQRLLTCISTDGRTWTPFAEGFPPEGEPKPCGQTGRVLTSNGIHVSDGVVYVIAEVHECFGGKDGKAWKAKLEAKTGRTTRRGRLGWGRLARAIKPDGTLGPIFWLVPDPPEPVDGRPPHPTASDERFATVAKALNERMADPLHMSAWDFRFHTNWTPAADGHGLCEPSVYRRPDSVLVKLSRDLAGSRRMYAALSRDGRTFAPAIQTRIPDAPSKSVCGTLPDGRTFLVGNQSIGRDPLVIGLSRDGVTFDWAAAIRHGAPKVRHPGRAKGPGFQYPSAIVVGDAMWVVYSVGKEDVAVSRVPLSALDR